MGAQTEIPTRTEITTHKPRLCPYGARGAGRVMKIRLCCMHIVGKNPQVGEPVILLRHPICTENPCVRCGRNFLGRQPTRRGDPTARWHTSFLELFSFVQRKKCIVPREGNGVCARRGVRDEMICTRAPPPDVVGSPTTFCTRNAFRVGIMCGGSLTVASLLRWEAFGSSRAPTPTVWNQFRARRVL